MRTIRLSIWCLFISLFLIANARAALFGNDGLDPSFCKPRAIRQTVVYVDEMMMQEGKTDWATKLATKLRATLIPGERVTVVRLASSLGQSSEIWSGCWPAFTEAERVQAANETRLFSRNRLAALVDQQTYFLRDFGGALTKIYAEAKRDARASNVDTKNPPPKQLLRALASDEARFSQSTSTIRAVLYSNLAENSNLGSAFAADATTSNYGRRLGSYLRRSVFYIYGIGENIQSETFNENARRFWSSALRSMAAAVGGIGTDLTISNNVPATAYLYGVELNFEGQPLDGRLSLLVDHEGNLVDSWIGISRLSISGLTGTFRCQGQDAATCRLDSSVVSPIATDSSAELLNLTGNARSGLDGKLGVTGTSAIFTIRTGPLDQ